MVKLWPKAQVRLGPYALCISLVAAILGIVWLAIDCIQRGLLWPVLVVAAVGCLFGELLHRGTAQH